MDTSNDSQDISNDDQLANEASNVRELIKKIRSEAGLGPMIKTKRPFIAITEQDTEEEISAKRQQIEKDQAEAAAARAALLDEKRTLFFSRLNSYSPRFQHRKRPFTALDCTKYGWRDTHLVGKSDPKTCILQCDDCHSKMFVITFDPNIDNPKVKQVTKIYKEGLINCHAESCQWRNGPDEDVTYNFPIQTLEEGGKRFKENAQMFIKSQQEYKNKMNNDSPQGIEENNSIPPLQHPLDESTLSKVYTLAAHFQQQAGDDETLDTETRNSAYLLSLFGWQLLDPLVPGAECELCCSRKGFYQMKNEEKFDLVKEHKNYCPWVNSENANAYSPKVSLSTRDRKISGYEWMVDMISIEFNLHMRNKYLSLSSRKVTDDQHYELKQKMYQANDLLKVWNSYSNKKQQ